MNMGNKKMTSKAARRIQAHADKTEKIKVSNQEHNRQLIKVGVSNNKP